MFLILRGVVISMTGCFMRFSLIFSMALNYLKVFGDLRVPELILTGVFFGITVVMILNFWIIRNLILMITICQMIIRLKLLLVLKGCISL